MDKKGIGKRRAERELQLMGMIRLRKKIGYTGEPWNIGECDFSNTLVVFIQYPPEKLISTLKGEWNAVYHSIIQSLTRYYSIQLLTHLPNLI